MKYPAPYAIDLEKPKGGMSWGGPPSGLMVAPGTFSVSLSKEVNGVITSLSESQEFEVVPLRKGALEGASPKDVAAFWRQYENGVRASSALNLALKNAKTKVAGMKKAIAQSTTETGALDTRLTTIRKNLLELDVQLNGSPSKRQPGEKTKPTIGERLFAVSRGIDHSTYGPTASHKRSLEIATTEMKSIQKGLEKNLQELSALAKELLEKGAPWMEGEVLPR